MHYAKKNFLCFWGKRIAVFTEKSNFLIYQIAELIKNVMPFLLKRGLIKPFATHVAFYHLYPIFWILTNKSMIVISIFITYKHRFNTFNQIIKSQFHKSYRKRYKNDANYKSKKNFSNSLYRSRTFYKNQPKDW